MAKRSKAKGTSRRRASADARGPEQTQALPELSTLQDIPCFGELSPSAAQLGEFARQAVGREGLELGCVVRLDRGYPALATESGVFRAEFSAVLSKAEDGRVAVGDWVCATRPEGHDMGVIEQVLARRNEVSRWRGAARGQMQVLAANVDLVLAVQALTEEGVDCARIARSVVLARDAGVACAAVLTKGDRTEGRLDEHLAAFDGFFGGTVFAVATQPDDADSVERVRELVGSGKVAIVLGATGAGKSTLLNALLGHELLETGEVRASDDSGRHTTVTRRMVSIPGAGVIVDEPGFRNLLVCGHERGLALVFPEIAGAAQECRFRDCTHTHEPGCAVREALGRGEYSEAQLAAYLSLADEMRAARDTLDPDIRL